MREKRSSKKLWTTVMIVCILVALLCVGALVWMHAQQAKVDKALEGAVSATATPTSALSAAPTPAPATPSPSSEPSETPAPEPTPEPTPPPEPVEIPIDFDYLKQTNRDIYSWICYSAFPAEQGYPVLSNAKEPDYYLQRDIYGNFSNAGSLYTQSNYNALDYSDPCTIIYGHDMMSGRMFGNMEYFTLALDLEDEENPDNYFTIYTPEKALTYRIACAGVYSNKHPLYFYDFSDEEKFDEFFGEYYNFPYGSRNICESFRPQFGDKLVILLTCHKLNNQYRYLTIGVLTEEHPALPAEQS